jgi:hypothetical protein
MKDLAIVGSPSVGGNSQVLTEACLSVIAEHGIDAECVHIADLNVSGCTDCGVCKMERRHARSRMIYRQFIRKCLHHRRSSSADQHALVQHPPKSRPCSFESASSLAGMAIDLLAKSGVLSRFRGVLVIILPLLHSCSCSTSTRSSFLDRVIGRSRLAAI